jgi:hypothetical protein
MANDIIEDDDYNPYAKLAKELNNRRIIGDLLKLTKEGEWVAGKDEEDIKPGTQLLAYVPSLHDGWVRWENQRPTNWEIGLVSHDHPKYGANRFRLKTRDELGDNDPDQWPARGKDKKEKTDPWQRTQYIVLVNPENEQLYTYGVHTKGGQQALGGLLEEWVNNCSRKGEAEQPIVKLGSDSYDHERYGETFYPILEIVDFTDELPQSLIDTGITETPKVEAAPAQKAIASSTQQPMQAVKPPAAEKQAVKPPPANTKQRNKARV